MKNVYQYIDKEILQQLYAGLEQVQYSRVACAIRIKTLQCLRELLPLQEPANFYERVLQSFDEFAAYFEDVCREDPNLPGPPCDEITTFQRTLRTYAFTTEELQLCYFREICQIHSPVRHFFCIEILIYSIFILFSMTIRQITEKLFFVLHMK
jgi:hypothetical protein